MSLLVWLPLLGNLNNQGVHSGNIENMGAVSSNASGKIGACMSFTGANTSNIRIPPILKNTDDMSFACWVKFNNTTNQCLFSQRVATNTYGFSIFYLNSTNLRFDDGDQLTASNVLTTNTWYHIVCCRDATHKYIYINGVLKASGARSNTSASNVNSNYAFIGGSQTNTAGTPAQTNANKLNGYLNDVRIYNHCLSAAEVKEISQGLVLHYKLDSITNNNLLKLAPKSYNSSNYNAYQLNLTENLVAGQTYTFQFWNVNVSHTGKTAAGLGISVYWGGGNVALKHMNGTSYFTNGHADYLTFTITITSSQASGSGASNAWLNIYNSVSNASGTKSMSIGAWKCEKGDVATPYTLSTAEAETQKIIDSSGYHHNGTVSGSLTSSSETPRYSSSVVIGNSSTYISTTNNYYSGDGKFSFNIWTKPSSMPVNAKYFNIRINESLLFNFGARSSGSEGQFLIFNGSKYYGPNGGFTITLNEWHMWTGTFDGTTAKLYKDAVLIKSLTSTSKYSLTITDTGTILGRDTAAQLGMASDARIYCTVLSPEDIKSLYEVSTRVDDKGNLHTYEINESNSNSLKKTGVFYNYATQPYMRLSDGSYWKLMLFHYVDNGNNLFTSSNATYNNGYGLYSRLRDIDNYKYDNKYEFYVIQDGTEHRWTQTNAPMTTTSVAGYTSVSGNAGGGICKCAAKTILAASSSGSSNWWRACGCYTTYSSGGRTGIPGFGGTGANNICTKYLALYVRITTNTYQQESGAFNANNLIEI